MARKLGNALCAPVVKFVPEGNYEPPSIHMFSPNTVTVREDTFRAARRLLEALAANRPLIVVLDDVHWGEPTLLDLVDHIADWSREAPILLLCLARPEFLDSRPGWGGGKMNAATILLEPLSEQEAETLIENLLVGSDLSDRLRQRNEFVIEPAEQRRKREQDGGQIEQGEHGKPSVGAENRPLGKQNLP